MSAKQHAGDSSPGTQEKPKSKRGGARPGTGGARAGAGRKPWNPTNAQRESVWAAISMGMLTEDIVAGIINPLTNRPIQRKTFERYFDEERRSAKQTLRIEIASRLVRDMRNGKTCGTTIFLAKVHLGLREPVRHEFDPQSPLNVNIAWQQ